MRLDNPNKYCFLCGKRNDLNNFAITDIDGTFHIICLKCKNRPNVNKQVLNKYIMDIYCLECDRLMVEHLPDKIYVCLGCEKKVQAKNV